MGPDLIAEFMNSPEYAAQVSDFNTRITAGEIISDTQTLDPEAQAQHFAYGLALCLDDLTTDEDLDHRKHLLGVSTALWIFAQNPVRDRIKQEIQILIEGPEPQRIEFRNPTQLKERLNVFYEKVAQIPQTPA